MDYEETSLIEKFSHNPPCVPLVHDSPNNETKYVPNIDLYAYLKDIFVLIYILILLNITYFGAFPLTQNNPLSVVLKFFRYFKYYSKGII